MRQTEPIKIYFEPAAKGLGTHYHKKPGRDFSRLYRVLYLYQILEKLHLRFRMEYIHIL